ncbi:MAG: hypothetical protein GOV15_01805, partial [Candidatus Diapherotrites archaeon]|nr:hypothetical protein [Candidatus Diapherotrites archaeon]
MNLTKRKLSVLILLILLVFSSSFSDAARPSKWGDWADTFVQLSIYDDPEDQGGTKLCHYSAGKSQKGSPSSPVIDSSGFSTINGKTTCTFVDDDTLASIYMGHRVRERNDASGDGDRKDSVWGWINYKLDGSGWNDTESWMHACSSTSSFQGGVPGFGANNLDDYVDSSMGFWYGGTIEADSSYNLWRWKSISIEGIGRVHFDEDYTYDKDGGSTCMDTYVKCPSESTCSIKGCTVQTCSGDGGESGCGNSSPPSDSSGDCDLTYDSSWQSWGTAPAKFTVWLRKQIDPIVEVKSVTATQDPGTPGNVLITAVVDNTSSSTDNIVDNLQVIITGKTPGTDADNEVNYSIANLTNQHLPLWPDQSFTT